MTVLDAQKALAEDLRVLFADTRLKGEDGKKRSISIFESMIPHPQTVEEPEPFPYAVVRADSGKFVEDSDDTSTAKLLILLGVYDDDEKYPLDRDVLMLIDRIAERYSKNYILSDYFQRVGEIEWSISDEDTYPYCFGGLEINFTIPKIPKEDDYC